MHGSIRVATREIKSEPQISVIIPTYNRERFVTKAIDSVLNQSFSDYEIIVIDDGSTDGTQKALETYLKKITYIYQDNSGVSSARNAGIKAAKGKWVALLDSDDEWTENYLSNQITQIKEFPHGVAHISNTVTIFPDGRRINLFVETGFMGRFKTKQYLVIEDR